MIVERHNKFLNFELLAILLSILWIGKIIIIQVSFH